MGKVTMKKSKDVVAKLDFSLIDEKFEILWCKTLLEEK